MEKIKGLYYIENVLNIDIINKLDVGEWKPLSNSKNSRYVQQYGYIYNYRNFTTKEKTTDIPDYLQPYVNVLNHYVNKFNLDDLKFNQCIINNYYKGQSISKHIDSLYFGSIIGCFTLCNSGIMRFTYNEEVIDLEVKPNSLYIMSDDARYKWSHEMLKLKNERRISITFRHVK